MSYQQQRRGNNTTINSWNNNNDGRGGGDDDDDDRDWSGGGGSGGSWGGGGRGDDNNDWNRGGGGRDHNNNNDWWDRRDDDDDDNDWWSRIFGRSKLKNNRFNRRKILNRNSYAYRGRRVNTNGFVKKWWDQFIFPYFNIPWPASPLITPGFPAYGAGLGPYGGIGSFPYSGYPYTPSPGLGYGGTGFGSYPGAPNPLGYPGLLYGSGAYGAPNTLFPSTGYTPPLPVPVSYKTTPGYPYNTVTPQYSSPYYY